MPRVRGTPDEHSTHPTKIAMGVDADLKIRLDEPIQEQLDALYADIYGNFPGATQKRFVGYVLARGIKAIREQHLNGRRKKR